MYCVNTLILTKICILLFNLKKTRGTNHHMHFKTHQTNKIKNKSFGEVSLSPKATMLWWKNCVSNQIMTKNKKVTMTKVKKIKK